VLPSGAQIAPYASTEGSRREASLLDTVVDFDFLRDAGIRIRGKESRAGEQRLSVELEIVPIPPQQDFEHYVQEQAAAGRRDAKPKSARLSKILIKSAKRTH
jgi:hypothetical protein